MLRLWFHRHNMTCIDLHIKPWTSERHASPYWTFIRRWISMGFTPSLLKKRMTERCSSLVHVCKRGRHLYTTTAPSCFIPASYCHLSATLQTMSIIVVSLQDPIDTSSNNGEHYEIIDVTWQCIDLHIKSSAHTNALQIFRKQDLVPLYLHQHWWLFIHSLVFSLRGRAGRNQSPLMWPVWLWHTASWASSWG